MKAVGYARVSSSEQVRGTSIDGQHEAIRQYALMKGVELVGIFTDPGISGSQPLARRPEGMKLIESLDEGTAEAVIVVKLDRGFRSASDCLNNVERWERQGVALHIIDLGGNSVDTRSPAGRFMLTVLAGAAEMERGMIRQRCDEGRRARKAEGKRIGEIPFGYSLASDGKTLLENVGEQKTISLVWALRAAGHNLRQIAGELNRRGLPAKKGGKWHPQLVSNILKRRTCPRTKKTTR